MLLCISCIRDVGEEGLGRRRTSTPGRRAAKREERGDSFHAPRHTEVRGRGIYEVYECEGGGCVSYQRAQPLDAFYFLSSAARLTTEASEAI